MPNIGDKTGSKFIAPSVLARELPDLRGVLAHPFTQQTIDDWITGATGRDFLLKDSFFGCIRWLKSLGRSTAATLADGFSLTLRNHFTLYYAGAGGEVITKDGWMDMPAPVTWDTTDDEEHYRVNYWGHYAQLNPYVDRNELRAAIVGSWTNPSDAAGRYLLPHPVGFDFGAFDGSVIVLDEITVVEDWHPNVPRFTVPIGR